MVYYYYICTWVVAHLLIVQVYIYRPQFIAALSNIQLAVVFVIQQLFFVNIGRTLYSLCLGEPRSVQYSPHQWMRPASAL